MKQLSVSQIKGSQGSNPHTEIPQEGTKRRELYDLFLSHRGKPLRHSLNQRMNSDINALRDFYGLDIRHLRQGWWILAGEYTSTGVYVDYIGAEGIDFTEMREERVLFVEALRLRDDMEMTYPEIAMMLGVTAGRVAYMIKIARSDL